jgi:hypothetical protein
MTAGTAVQPTRVSYVLFRSRESVVLLRLLRRRPQTTGVCGRNNRATVAMTEKPVRGTPPPTLMTVVAGRSLTVT